MHWIKRTFTRGALGAAAALALLTGSLGSSAFEAGGRLTVVQGSVAIGRGEPPVWTPARIDDRVAAGDAVRTGRGGRAEIELGSGTVRLYENSLLRLPADAFGASGAAEAVELEAGESLFDVLRERLDRAFEVRTPEVVVSVKGTRFGVSLAEELAAVAVYRGLVGVLTSESELDAEVLVREGFAAVGGAGHPPELLAIRDGDPWSGWAEGEQGTRLVPSALLRQVRRNPVERARELAELAVQHRLDALGAGSEGSPRPSAKAGANALPAEPASLAEKDDGAPTPPQESLLDQRDGEGYRPVERVVTERVTTDALALPPGSGSGSPPPASGSTGDSAPLPFSMEVVTSGGPNHVDFFSPDGTLVHSMFQEDVESAVEGGLEEFGPILETLHEMGINPLLFAQQLDKML
jgi:ferric-dicitrate binding protein FerR (iron transport regulator)